MCASLSRYSQQSISLVRSNRPSSQHLLAAKNFNKFTQMLFLKDGSCKVGEPGVLRGGAKLWVCYSQPHTTGSLGTHPPLSPHRGLVHLLSSLPATFIDGRGAGVGLACQQQSGQAQKGVCVFSASIPNSETVTI